MQDLLEKLEKIDKLQGKIGTSAIGGGSTSTAGGGTDTKKVDDIKSDTEQILAKVEFMRSRLYGTATRAESPVFQFEKVSTWMENESKIINDILTNIEKSSTIKTPEGRKALEESLHQVLVTLSQQIASGEVTESTRVLYQEINKALAGGAKGKGTANALAHWLISGSWEDELKYEKTFMSGGPAEPNIRQYLDMTKFEFEEGKMTFLEQNPYRPFSAAMLRRIWQKVGGVPFQTLSEFSGVEELSDEEISQLWLDILGEEHGGRTLEQRRKALTEILLKAKNSVTIPFKDLQDLIDVMIGTEAGSQGDLLSKSNVVRPPTMSQQQFDIWNPSVEEKSKNIGWQIGKLPFVSKTGLKRPDIFAMFSEIGQPGKDFEKMLKEFYESQGVETTIKDEFVIKLKKMFESFMKPEASETFSNLFSLYIDTMMERSEKKIPFSGRKGSLPSDDDFDVAMETFTDLMQRPSFAEFKSTLNQKTLEEIKNKYGLNPSDLFMLGVITKLSEQPSYVLPSGQEVGGIQIGLPARKELTEDELDELKESVRENTENLGEVVIKNLELLKSSFDTMSKSSAASLLSSITNLIQELEKRLPKTT